MHSICEGVLGRFERNAPYLHVRSGKTSDSPLLRLSWLRKKNIVDEAFPAILSVFPTMELSKIGDTVTLRRAYPLQRTAFILSRTFHVHRERRPHESQAARQRNPAAYGRGVAQLFVHQFNGRKIIGTVGQLQFEVIQYRLLHEYGAQCRWEPMSMHKACWVESDDAAVLDAFKKRKFQFMATDREGRDVFLADSAYVLTMAQNDFPKIRFHFSSEF